MPIIIMANPRSAEPVILVFSDLQNNRMATPMIARIGEKKDGLIIVRRSEPPSIAFKDSIHAVAVVPRLAPITSPAALPNSIIPELTSPTESTVIADDDCTIAVTTVPKQYAKKRFLVMPPITFLRAPPVSDVRDSLKVSIPVRNSASPPSIVVIIVNISIVVIYTPFP